MRIEAVIPCVHYDDFLALTLPRNVRVLDSITVLTSWDDSSTAAIADGLGLKVLRTDAWSAGSFNKGRALNAWLDALTPVAEETWLLVLDADIVLPESMRTCLGALDATKLYGAPRRMCDSERAWQDFAAGRRDIRSFPLDMPPVWQGRIWNLPTVNPAAIYGCFQLWNPARSRGGTRFVEAPTAAGYDVAFALSYADADRSFVPGLEILHLGECRVNWNGRCSSRWRVPSAQAGPALDAWQPVLEGALAADAEEAALAIARELLAGYVKSQPLGHLCDTALLFAYAAALDVSDPLFERSIQNLEIVIGRLGSRQGLPDNLHGGLAGVGWTCQHLASALGHWPDTEAWSARIEAVLDGIDRDVVTAIETNAINQHYDLLNGLAGLAVYFLERLPRPSAVTALQTIVRRLDDAREGPGSLPVWLAQSPYSAPTPRRGQGRGVATGPIGIAYVLLECMTAGIAPPLARALLDECAHVLVSDATEEGQPDRYPVRSLAWCSGRLGALPTITRLAVAVGNRPLMEKSKAWLRELVALGADTGVRTADTSICHGAIGIAHLYNSLYQSSREADLKHAALDWFGIGLAMRHAPTPIGGFPAWRAHPTPGWLPDTAIRTGAAGVALALLAATRPVAPGWDRMLALSPTARVPVVPDDVLSVPSLHHHAEA
jgi:lantibiotic biosynthesis protein